jgi:hypothetical protein
MTKEQEEQFDKKFGSVSHETAHLLMNTDSTKVTLDNTAIKEWINDLLFQNRLNLIKELEGMKSQHSMFKGIWEEVLRNSALNEVINKLKE